MGMDMHTVDPPRDLPPAYVAQSKDDPGYYRFRTSAMVVMTVVMKGAGVVVDEPPPKWPEWPPKDVPPDRLKLVEQAVSEGKLASELTEGEKKIVTAAIEVSKKVRATRSSKPGAVPSFKFGSNDGWIVTTEECAIIAAGLRRYAEKLKEQDLSTLSKEYADTQHGLLQATKPHAEVLVQGYESLGMTLGELRKWVLEWAAYNDVASRSGGYVVQ
jgi:hypothetical protein